MCPRPWLGSRHSRSGTKGTGGRPGVSTTLLRSEVDPEFTSMRGGQAAPRRPTAHGVDGGAGRQESCVTVDRAREFLSGPSVQVAQGAARRPGHLAKICIGDLLSVERNGEVLAPRPPDEVDMVDGHHCCRRPGGTCLRRRTGSRPGGGRRLCRADRPGGRRRPTSCGNQDSRAGGAPEFERAGNAPVVHGQSLSGPG